ncbi:hypothetical protein [Agromyces cerinus]|uniref:Uncharacterized protein n=1 Tax=Agromyces cerinus subsp. cerinus TaxID=232089 RepID=A0A1N6DQ30_9MICO|nr:hypothetical protein [Agromyces cerinus]SIN72909.1 hypothetical protein SAMN05443544_0585 [Agromyces cerinus subsp. cerinus]
MKIPPINLPLDAVAHARWLEQRAVAAETELRDLRSWKETVTRQLSMTAGDSTGTNVRVETNRTDILELKGRAGVPAGGRGGWVLRRATDTGELRWAVDVTGAQPQCDIYLGVLPSWLDEGDPRYSWYPQILGSSAADYDAAQAMMPILSVTDTVADLGGGTGYRTGSTSPVPLDADNAAPARYSVHVSPVFDGQAFDIMFPADLARTTNSPWSHIDIGVYNDGGETGEYKAELHLRHLSGTYAGTRVAPGEWYDDPATGSNDWDARKMFLEADELLSWRVENVGGNPNGMAGSQIVPSITNAGSGSLVAATGDKWWEMNVKGRELVFPFSGIGPLEVSSAAHRFRNSRRDIIGISLVTAEVTDAPVGASIQVDVKVGGVSIFASPLTILAGETFGSAVPALSRWPLGSTGMIDGPADQIALAPWAPGDAATLEIVQVGSPGTEGANLTVLMWAG